MRLMLCGPEDGKDFQNLRARSYFRPAMSMLRFTFVRRITAERAHHLGGAGQDAEVEISTFEARQDVVVDNRAALRVGELSFEVVADWINLCSLGATISSAPSSAFRPMPQSRPSS